MMMMVMVVMMITTMVVVVVVVVVMIMMMMIRVARHLVCTPTGMALGPFRQEQDPARQHIQLSRVNQRLSMRKLVCRTKTLGIATINPLYSIQNQVIQSASH
jgi:hypothetical protein